MTIVGEAVVVWTATGLSVITDWLECPTYDYVNNAHRLVLVSSTLSSLCISIKEYQHGIT
ncbi:hypothetical protein [Bacillus toyonensis]|uniref:hypothetical protein n=1 Tax=Bacillus toyonensis TaxID=155322 RepID=UPI0015D50283|nr:hypothetical protein [Bacillus toyonensis]